jgi:phosphatidylserine/phosphatidylglycerophosphate/cardiolipin synthase-like enzyme
VSDSSIELSFLQDGAQSAVQVAQELGAFLGAARLSLDMAIYDLNLSLAAADVVRAALQGAAARGVRVRLLYNINVPSPIPVPRPSEADTDFIDSLQVPSRPVAGIPALMHHKYVIRDAADAGAAVWTGSTNWTNDSWTREENVIIRLASPMLAAAYERNFQELWSSALVEASGKDQPGHASLTYAGQPVSARVFFSPGRGKRMAQVIADRLAHARRRIRLCSPVITDGPILGTLGDLVAHGHPDFKGVYDRTQMEEVMAQWHADPHAAWKAPCFESVRSGLSFSSKITTPYAPNSVHDYMHAKLTVVDDVVFAGSYNLSHSGEENAENLLELQSAALADTCAAFVEALYARYAGASQPAAQ